MEKNLLYKDKQLSTDGVQLLLVKAGVEGKGKIKVRAKGPQLPIPSLPFAATPSLEVQLRNSAGGCWSSTFDTAEARNEEERFQAKY